MREDERQKVLVVEDSPLMQDMIGFALKSLRVEVTRARNGLEGLEKVALGKFDLILTDVVMPEIGGIEFIRSLRKMPDCEAVPVVVISTQGAKEAIEAGLAAGANDYMTKPFRPQELARMIRKHLREE